MNAKTGAPLLPLPVGCQRGFFIRRWKRFSVEIALEKGTAIMAHCNNTGAMTGLSRPGAPVLFSRATGKYRKLAFTLERVWIGQGNAGFWVGVNTTHPHRMLDAAFQARLLNFASGYASLRREARLGQSRLDALLEGPHLPPLWVECKNVTLVEEETAYFPDAASERARKHLRELLALKARGARAAMFYLVQRPDARCFAPADFIDPEYARLFYEALGAGVEAYAYVADLGPEGSGLGRVLKIRPPM